MITAYYWIKWQHHALQKLIPNNNRPGCCIRTCRCFWEYVIRSSSSSFLLNRARFKRFDHIRVFILVLCMVLSSEHTRYPDGSIQRSSPTCNLQDAVFVSQVFCKSVCGWPRLFVCGIKQNKLRHNLNQWISYISCVWFWVIERQRETERERERERESKQVILNSQSLSSEKSWHGFHLGWYSKLPSMKSELLKTFGSSLRRN